MMFAADPLLTAEQETISKINNMQCSMSSILKLFPKYSSQNNLNFNFKYKIIEIVNPQRYE